jgi:tetratricopeptide (TPR) repeat protein
LAFDREDTLKKAEKLLRQGRLDAAITEYARVLDDQPKDWNTANTLGDLYSRAGQTDKAVAQYTRIADHLVHEGFYPRAAALYKKILKIKPDDESAQIQLGELSARQGLLADAKSYFSTIVGRRRSRGDRAGADEMIVRLGSVDPADVEGRLAAARVLEQNGDAIAAAMRFRELHADLLERNRPKEALDALREAVRLNPDDREGRAELAREAVAAGDFETARQFLDADTAAGDPALLLALLTIEVRSGTPDRPRELIRQLLEADAAYQDRVVELGWSLADEAPDQAFVCVETTVDLLTARSAYVQGADLLKRFVERIPGQIPALLKLVEVCVDGGLESDMYETQAQLTDAYLARGQAAEARVIAEDLVAREPWERNHIERFRRALVMLKVSDPDTLIAERLSGQAPFMATDHFVELEPAPTAVGQETGPAPAGAAEAAQEAPEPEPPPPAPPVAPRAASPRKPADEDEIDLTVMLGDLEGNPEMSPTDPKDLDRAFKDFRSEVRRQDGSEEAAQHLKLAQTYLEMGMSEEAIGSLETAARSPRYRFEAASMLGRLHRGQKDLPRAIEWFERAAEAPAPAADAGRELLYDLGSMLEETGEVARALAVFLELQADAGDYRDVARRVERLSRVQTGG